MKYFIITGASKGLGEGIALELARNGNHLFVVSRTESKQVKKQALENGCGYSFIPFDLAYSHDTPQLARSIFEQIALEKAIGVYLVNNAGILEPVGRAELCDADAVEHHIHINLLAPMLLSAAFIQLTSAWPIQKRILNISSGAAVNPYWGWSSYCTGKAGLDMYTRCVALEQSTQPHPIEIMSVAPGIIDTSMQEFIRNTTDEQFLDRKKFVEFKESGMLVHPHDAGKRIAALLISDEFKNGAIVDLRKK